MIKPKVVLSRCFGIAPVRYDGGIIIDEFVENLKKYVDYIDLCPEFDIGLGVPRERIIIVKEGNKEIFFQLSTKRDLTTKINDYANKVLEENKDIDGFLLKSKSPSCGVSSTKLYQNDKVIGKTWGLFAKAVRERFPYLALADEKGLDDSSIRHHFLIKIFAFSELRAFKKSTNSLSLADFHSTYRYLLMSYNKKILKYLDRIVANRKIDDEKIKDYVFMFYKALIRKPSRLNHLNTIFHIYSHFTKYLNSKEKQYFLTLTENFRKGLVELPPILKLLKRFAYKYENPHLLAQKYLTPYPEELTDKGSKSLKTVR